MRGQIHKLLAVLTVTLIGMGLYMASPTGSMLSAQMNGQQAEATPPAQSYYDEFDRSYRINHYKAAADSGAGRGETIYFYKCWMCHNKYTIAAEPGVAAPNLKDLFKRENLRSGEAVDDDSVTKQIKDGNFGMPSFRTSLSDTDIQDLLTYLKSGKCCWDGEDPPANPWYQAEVHKWPVPSGLNGGTRGVVRIASGDPPEGIMVQLIAPNGVRTTVYTDERGNYEFPRMQTGSYTLRIAEPLEFKPYRRDVVRVDGTAKLDDIVLERINKEENVPATPELESQLGGMELLWNLPGSAQEKQAIHMGCGCHTYQQILRNRYDQRSWSLIVHRMLHYTAAPLISPGGGGRGTDGEPMIVNWLSKVRGPDAKDPNIQIMPRAHGAGTRVVVTEYELPRVLLSTHDVTGDAKGNIWFTSHKTRYFGKLDPRTGIVTSYMLPLTPGAMPGSHHIVVDKNGSVYISENWARKLTKFDPTTGEFHSVMAPTKGGFGNFALGPDGFIWYSEDHAAIKIDPETGKIVDRIPMASRETYETTVSDDGKYWAAGSPGSVMNTLEFIDLKTRKAVDINTGDHFVSAARGGFDPQDNAWFGSRMGTFLEIDSKTGLLHEYYPPIPYSPFSEFYEVMPDHNGEVWGGMQTGRQMIRFNPKTDRWIEYKLPEPFSYDRRNWIDNSTNPVSVWYVDYQGYILRVQPLPLQ